MKSDSWFYRFFRKLPAPFFAMAGLPPESAPHYFFEAVELKDVALRVDGVFRPGRPHEPHLFVESQLYFDRDFYLSWCAKMLMYLAQQPIHGDFKALVLFESRTQEPSPSPWIKEWIEKGRIARVLLDEMP